MKDLACCGCFDDLVVGKTIAGWGFVKAANAKDWTYQLSSRYYHCGMVLVAAIPLRHVE